jgi:hypothetical protein
MYLTELPVLALFILAVIFNDSAAGVLKLYPLIITSAAIMIFIFVFFFRVIVLSAEEIEIIGRFTSRESALINKGKRLNLTLDKKNRLKLELFEDDGVLPELDFLKNDPTYKPLGLNLFRERAVFGKNALDRVLRYFEIDRESRHLIFESDTYECTTPILTLKSENNGEVLSVSIEFTETI